LERLELAENQITGGELKHLKKYADSLQVLKMASNKITSLSDLDVLKDLKCLKNLDLANNEVNDVAGYKAHVWDLISSLEILDNHNKDGEEAFSDDDEDYGSDDDDDLTPTTRAKLIARAQAAGDDVNDGFIDDYGDEGFEGGEDDMDDFDDESGDADVLDKQEANKRQKN